MGKRGAHMDVPAEGGMAPSVKPLYAARAIPATAAGVTEVFLRCVLLQWTHGGDGT